MRDSPRIVVRGRMALGLTSGLVLRQMGFAHAYGLDDGPKAEMLAINLPADVFITTVLFGIEEYGIDMALKVKERVPDCRVIILCGQDPKRIEHMADGFRWVEMPVHPPKLAEIIREELQ